MSITHRVLIVEDDPHTLSGYVEFLTAAGFEPVGAARGADALATALGHPPAAVVTDITLQDMSGFELATALRADSRTGPFRSSGSRGTGPPKCTRGRVTSRSR